MDRFPIKHKMDHNISQILMKKNDKKGANFKILCGFIVFVVAPPCFMYDT